GVALAETGAINEAPVALQDVGGPACLPLPNHGTFVRASGYQACSRAVEASSEDGVAIGPSYIRSVCIVDRPPGMAGLRVPNHDTALGVRHRGGDPPAIG